MFTEGVYLRRSSKADLDLGRILPEKSTKIDLVLEEVFYLRRSSIADLVLERKDSGDRVTGRTRSIMISDLT